MKELFVQMHIENILFDIDDTLLDFKWAEYHAVKKTFEDMGLCVDDALIERYSEINLLQWEKLERREQTREQTLLRRFELLFEELGVSLSAERAQAEYETLLGIGHKFIDGAPELLEALYGKYRLYIVSNGTLSVQESRLKSAGILPYFEDAFISEKLGHNKPSREYFDIALGALDRSKTLIVGDSLSSDILGGLNAGILTCWFNPKGKPPRFDVRPDFEIGKLSELTELLASVEQTR